MRAKFIYEKFVSDSDPIKDLGIGIEAILNKIKASIAVILENAGLLSKHDKKMIKIKDNSLKINTVGYLDFYPLQADISYELIVKFPMNIFMEWSAAIEGDEILNGKIETDTLKKFEEEINQLCDDVEETVYDKDIRDYGYCECGNRLDDYDKCEECDYEHCEVCGDPVEEDELIDDMCPYCAEDAEADAEAEKEE